MLEVKNLSVSIHGKPILGGLNLTVKTGEVAAIMGPNGSGKSTLSYVVAGKPDYEVTSGEIFFDGENILALAPDARATRGLFLAFQYPIEIPGVATMTFLKASLNAQRRARGEADLTTPDFMRAVRGAAQDLKIDPNMLKRPLNVGFSGGEKKRMEILQMTLLAPRLAVLDETDFGPRHRRFAHRRRWRQRVARSRAVLPRHHALPATARIHQAGRGPCHGQRPHRQFRRPRTGAGVGTQRLPRLRERGGVTTA